MAAPGRKKGPAPRARATTSGKARRQAAPAARAAVRRPGESTPSADPASARNGLGAVALGLGVLAVLTSPTLTFGVLLGVGAMVVGFLARQRVARGEATNKGSTTAAMALGAAALAIVAGLIIYGRILLSSPAGERYTDCLDRAGDDRAAAGVCEDTFERER